MDLYISPILIIYVLFLHFVTDFIFQSRTIATTKSKSIVSLTIHCSIYSLGLFAGLLFVDTNINSISSYAFGNGVYHFLTDFFTSRLTTKFYQEDKMHQFWIVIGADQFIHSTILILSIELLI